MAQSQDLALELKPSRKAYQLGEPIEIQWGLRNLTEKSIKFFKPDNINVKWMGWDMTCRITRPDGRQMTIEPNIYYSFVPHPEEKYFLTLEPADYHLLENMDLSTQQELPEDARKTETDMVDSGYGRWVATFPLSLSESEMSNDHLRSQFDIRGNYYFISTGKDQHLALQDFLVDVFDQEGVYELTCSYRTDYSHASKFDDEQKMALKKVENVWAGTVSDNCSIVIRDK